MNPTKTFTNPEIYMYAICMNAFDRHKKNKLPSVRIVMASLIPYPLATMHRDQKGHKLKITEFWVTGR